MSAEESTPPAFRRSFTSPATSERSSEGASPEAKVDVLYVHPSAKVVSFDAFANVPKTLTWRNIEDDASLAGVLPWSSKTETTMAVGPLQIYKVLGTTAFLHSGKMLLTLMKRSQCWCVDGDSKFAMRIQGKCYRIDLPTATEEDKKRVEEMKKVFGQVLLFEKTACPFGRSFTVDLPESPVTPKRVKYKGLSKRARKWEYGTRWRPEGYVEGQSDESSSGAEDDGSIAADDMQFTPEQHSEPDLSEQMSPMPRSVFQGSKRSFTAPPSRTFADSGRGVPPKLSLLPASPPPVTAPAPVPEPAPLQSTRRPESPDPFRPSLDSHPAPSIIPSSYHPHPTPPDELVTVPSTVKPSAFQDPSVQDDTHERLAGQSDVLQEQEPEPDDEPSTPDEALSPEILSRPAAEVVTSSAPNVIDNPSAAPILNEDVDAAPECRSDSLFLSEGPTNDQFRPPDTTLAAPLLSAVTTTSHTTSSKPIPASTEPSTQPPPPIVLPKRTSKHNSSIVEPRHSAPPTHRRQRSIASNIAFSTFALFMSPPSELVAIMIKLAARIASGALNVAGAYRLQNGGSGGGKEAVRLPGRWEDSDGEEAEEEDEGEDDYWEDDYGVPLGNNASSKVRRRMLGSKNYEDGTRNSGG